ncbi:MAG TPA: creatininase family protein [Alphaproteobacteria bacterium]|jgi:creatinine amidohydrolase
MADNPMEGGYSIFHETMADMTYPELEQAARDGAVALWALGVIEQHGPHLPLGTDVYVPSATLRAARRRLADRGIASVIVPPFYWGVNHVTAQFPGSFEVRPEVMIELMKDVFRSLRKDGFGAVYCLSGHGDALHNQTILEGVKAGSAAAPIDGKLVVAPAMAKRLGFAEDDPYLALTAAVPADDSPYLDIHAGRWETSFISALYPDVVRDRIAAKLPPTNLGPADLAEWRKGREHAKRKTPDGYFGDPAAASREKGLALLDQEATLVAESIAADRSRVR